jgi:hypothetical protein
MVGSLFIRLIVHGVRFNIFAQTNERMAIEPMNV